MRKKIVLIFLFVLLPVSSSWSWILPWGGKKNIILIVPDGCSAAMWATLRAMTVGSDGLLNVDKMEIQSRCRTYSANAMITDSAAAATAFACGVKTANGVLGMSAKTVFGDSLTGRPVENIIEMAKKAGYATGIVSTAMVQHATPAAFYSHRPNRNWYELIAGDLVISGIDVIMGGGGAYMIPKGVIDEEGLPSKRTDNRNLIEEMKRKEYTFVHDTRGLEILDIENTAKLLGIFDAGHMEYEFDRKDGRNDDPGLWVMTEKAIEILSKKKKGFFLMVEAARIDHAGHSHDTDRFLWEGIACDKAVGVAREFALKDKNTLVIVVPDHGTGGPHLAGMYMITGGDSTLVSYDKAGFPDYGINQEGFPVFDGGKPVAVQWIDSAGHTGEDVGIHAMGPTSKKLCGLMQNTDIFKIIAEYLNFKEEMKDLSEIIDY